MADRTCLVAGCGAEHYARDMCRRHYARARKRGELDTTAYGLDPLARIMRDHEVDEVSGCWNWTASRNANGYGRLHFGASGKMQLAHRLAYELLVGPIPDGLVLDHLCRNRSCINPDHLEPVTDRVNILRGEGWAARAARQTHCPSGHPYDEVNTYQWRGIRYCRACRAAAHKRRFALLDDLLEAQR